METDFLSEDILIVLGPTASGKTKLAVSLAQVFDAEIISADSRQVYRHMDIGTGKDLQEYQDVPYHLIDILNPGEKYNISSFLRDFDEVFQAIKSRGKKVLVCGGTGFYLQALLESRPYMHISVNDDLRSAFINSPKEELVKMVRSKNPPPGYNIDFNSKKRLIRALEVLSWLADNPSETIPSLPVYAATVIGLNPAVEVRRERISKRLAERLESGMIDEVKFLVAEGITYEEMEYYGLEYKYISYYLQGKLDYTSFVIKLETEIHRYAKRQMTYFRKMEKDGVKIHWLYYV
ncbi:tRNA (adenosine(37)-N6)-dimethylallyltransferase MiaA [Sphingobacterium pedocola]|uniref:tRNA dimethylallyltransferase n=1 Tax=Sphingobacterium pedocola TaxID=2082722 RepID=A0ABR9T8R1_9SPHI|nr:tRNA (adenosine(37)-N6)-dimethylallyltransferase MiaA [Sphingobacterium pedocola]MBE8721474.1 tRNA (adenosine(37)-N6)-dimethylallyltransferase MiaA [Sphingobacterium pedocola]